MLNFVNGTVTVTRKNPSVQTSSSSVAVDCWIEQLIHDNVNNHWPVMPYASDDPESLNRYKIKFNYEDSVVVAPGDILTLSGGLFSGKYIAYNFSVPHGGEGFSQSYIEVIALRTE
jgi:hypothetical protein